MDPYDVNYFIGRQRRLQLIYRLRRRTDEVEAALRHYQDGQLQVIVDVGTADGLMLEKLRQRMGPIEHVPDASAMLQECAHMLRPDGLLVITTPDPFLERLSSAIGLLKETGHQRTFNLGELRQLANENGFRVLEAYKFMFSPIGFPAEKAIERVLRVLGLDLIMANQLLVARRA
jgi:hypothetical protein